MLKKLLAVLMMLFTALAMAAVDVNKASEADLDTIKGIGPGTAKQILAERQKGQFKDWADFIARTKGVAEKRAANLSGAGLTVNGTAYKAAAAPAEKKDAKAAAKDDKKAAADEKKAAKDDKKEAKAAAKDDKKDAKMAAKDDKASAKADAGKPAASAAKPAASAAKPAASAASAAKK